MPVVPDEVLDHFKIWELMPAPLADPIHVEDTYQVILKDQFHSKDGITRTIRRIEWIANPVQKYGQPVRHAGDRLTGYRFREEAWQEADKVVTIRNQFTHRKRVKWQLGAPKFLLVPATLKLGGTGSPPPTPKRFHISHYLCYAVTKAQPMTPKPAVNLRDQFDLHLERHETIATLTPRFLGVPVEKNGEQMVFKDAHLAIYELDPADLPKKPIKFSARDQFKIWRGLDVVHPRYLAVPSEKEWLESQQPEK